MQFKNRETLTGDAQLFTSPADVTGMPQCSMNMTLHSVGGTLTTFDVQMQTSDNLEDWFDVGNSFGRTTVGVALEEINVRNHKYGRYVRAEIAITGTNPLVNYSLWLNTFPSS